MAPPLFALRYMTRFKCIAQACEDSCCTGMKVLLTQADRERLTAAMARPGDKEELEAKVSPLPERPDGFESEIALRPDRTCSFLEGDRLCSVWKRHGESVLPDVCSLFPRVLSYLDERVEVAGTLACPEAARLCLLAEDSLELVEAPSSVTERVPPVTRGTPEPYVAHLEEVRACGVELLGLTRYPVQTRLMMIAELGFRTAGFFHRGAPPFDPALLREELARSRRPEVQEELHQSLAAVEAPGEVALQVVVRMLTSLQPAGTARYNQMVNVILNGYMQAAMQLEPQAGEPGGPGLFSVLQRVYEARRERLDAVLGEKISQYCTRYCLNEWYREWYTKSPDLLSHAFKLLLRLSALRFLLAGHPMIEQAPEPCAVEIFQIFTKQVERDLQLMSLLDQTLTPETLGVDAAGRAVLFAKACG
ncbi:flagellin lysine-N-methylase [Hyalangium sp.]|uniref:flagellin lysine-N-methylase n=1 Tax=Hyalangium sp. TaxID=2028555 RepID=UPI002D7399B6|nr:flagellin lysine-N-methylase [Hyalangium sp.]HYH98036.1 flagellin lysine-N-methylase [Hyalangium sp.]